MRILLDTHMILWCFSDEPLLSAKAISLIEDEQNEIFYSTASVWEIAIKHHLHPDKMLIDEARFVRYCQMSDFHPLAINNNHVLALSSLAYPDNCKPHNDPFDRIMIAQAKAENMLFLSHDSLVANYDEGCVVPV